MAGKKNEQHWASYYKIKNIEMEANQIIDANLLYAGNSFYVQFVDESRQDMVFSYDEISSIGTTVDTLLTAIKENNINILNGDSFKFFSEPMDSISAINESMNPNAEALLEFEMFNVTRRDITSFSDFIKKAKDITKVVTSGKDLSGRKFQQGFMHEIKRDSLFKHPAFDNLYKSFGEKDEKKRKEQEGGNYVTPGAYPAAVGSF